MDDSTDEITSDGTTNVDDDVVDDDLRKWLKKSLHKVEMNMKRHLDEKCDKFFEQIKHNTLLANEALASSKQNAEDIAKQGDSLTTSNNKLATLAEQFQTFKTSMNDTLVKLEHVIDIQALKLNQYEYRLEQETNRNSRKSLTIRGVEEKNDKTWDETRMVVCDKLSEITGVHPTNISNMIERVHRSPAKPHKDGRPRTIHALFYDWNDSEKIKSLSRMNSAGHNVFVEQRYGPDTQYRKNQAMILRREMKDAGKISAGYVAYPAKLMVKFNKNDKKYVCHKDFSKIPVPIRPVPDDEQL